MTCSKKRRIFFVCSAMVGIPLTTSFAQFYRDPWMSGYVGAHSAGTRHCPGMAWHISPVQQADLSFNLSGPIWFEDGSGMSFAKGTRQPDGSFSLNVTSASGDGPTGTISGRRAPDGSADVTTAGSPCFEGTYHIAPGQTSTK